MTFLCSNTHIHSLIHTRAHMHECAHLQEGKTPSKLPSGAQAIPLGLFSSSDSESSLLKRPGQDTKHTSTRAHGRQRLCWLAPVLRAEVRGDTGKAGVLDHRVQG